MTRKRSSPLGLEVAVSIALTLVLLPLLAQAAPVQDAMEVQQFKDGCYYNYNHYGEGDRIMTNEPCLNCTCHNKMLMCYLRVCPFTKPIGHDCIVEKREDQCCPIITCPEVPVDVSHSAPEPGTELSIPEKYGCSIEEKFYPEGAQVPSNPNKPCELCYCIKNRTSCLMQECTLHIDGCTPIYNKGSCCPVRYNCDHENDVLELEDASTTTTTTVRPTPGFILTTTMSPSISMDCVHNGEVYADGASITGKSACEHCYCMRGDIVCAVQECEMPMLAGNGKSCHALPPAEGECCPSNYVCEDDTATTEIIQATTAAYVDKDRDATKSPLAGIHDKISEEDLLLQAHIDEDEEEEPSSSTEDGPIHAEKVEPSTGDEVGSGDFATQSAIDVESETTIAPTRKVEQDIETESTTEAPVHAESVEEDKIEKVDGVTVGSITEAVHQTSSEIIADKTEDEEEAIDEDTTSSYTESDMEQGQYSTTIRSIVSELPTSADETEEKGPVVDSEEQVETTTVKADENVTKESTFESEESEEEVTKDTTIYGEEYVTADEIEDEKTDVTTTNAPIAGTEDEIAVANKDKDVIETSISVMADIIPEDTVDHTDEPLAETSTEISGEDESFTTDKITEVEEETIDKEAEEPSESQKPSPDSAEQTTVSPDTERIHTTTVIPMVDTDDVHAATSEEVNEPVITESVEEDSTEQLQTAEGAAEDTSEEGTFTHKPSDTEVPTTINPLSGIFDVEDHKVDEHIIHQTTTSTMDTPTAHIDIDTDDNVDAEEDKFEPSTSTSAPPAISEDKEQAEALPTSTEVSDVSPEESETETDAGADKEDATAGTDIERTTVRAESEEEKTPEFASTSTPSVIYDDKTPETSAASTEGSEDTTDLPEIDESSTHPTFEVRIDLGNETTTVKPAASQDSEISDMELPSVIPGEGDCLVGHKTYTNNSNIPTSDECEISCTCVSSIVVCKRVQCEVPANLEKCTIDEASAFSCCPTYNCPIDILPPTTGDEASSEEDKDSFTTQLPSEKVDAALTDDASDESTTLTPPTDIIMPAASTEQPMSHVKDETEYDIETTSTSAPKIDLSVIDTETPEKDEKEDEKQEEDLPIESTDDKVDLPIDEEQKKPLEETQTHTTPTAIKEDGKLDVSSEPLDHTPSPTIEADHVDTTDISSGQAELLDHTEVPTDTQGHKDDLDDTLDHTVSPSIEDEKKHDLSEQTVDEHADKQTTELPSQEEEHDEEFLGHTEAPYSEDEEKPVAPLTDDQKTTDHSEETLDHTISPSLSEDNMQTTELPSEQEELLTSSVAPTHDVQQTPLETTSNQTVAPTASDMTEMSAEKDTTDIPTGDDELLNQTDAPMLVEHEDNIDDSFAHTIPPTTADDNKSEVSDEAGEEDRTETATKTPVEEDVTDHTSIPSDDKDHQKPIDETFVVPVAPSTDSDMKYDLPEALDHTTVSSAVADEKETTEKPFDEEEIPSAVAPSGDEVQKETLDSVVSTTTYPSTTDSIKPQQPDEKDTTDITVEEGESLFATIAVSEDTKQDAGTSALDHTTGSPVATDKQEVTEISIEDNFEIAHTIDPFSVEEEEQPSDEVLDHTILPSSDDQKKSDQLDHTMVPSQAADEQEISTESYDHTTADIKDETKPEVSEEILQPTIAPASTEDEKESQEDEEVTGHTVAPTTADESNKPSLELQTSAPATEDHKIDDVSDESLAHTISPLVTADEKPTTEIPSDDDSLVPTTSQSTTEDHKKPIEDTLAHTSAPSIEDEKIHEALYTTTSPVAGDEQETIEVSSEEVDFAHTTVPTTDDEKKPADSDEAIQDTTTENVASDKKETAEESLEATTDDEKKPADSDESIQDTTTESVAGGEKETAEELLEATTDDEKKPADSDESIQDTTTESVAGGEKETAEELLEATTDDEKKPADSDESIQDTTTESVAGGEKETAEELLEATTDDEKKPADSDESIQDTTTESAAGGKKETAEESLEATTDDEKKPADSDESIQDTTTESVAGGEKETAEESLEEGEDLPHTVSPSTIKEQDKPIDEVLGTTVTPPSSSIEDKEEPELSVGLLDLTITPSVPSDEKETTVAPSSDEDESNLPDQTVIQTTAAPSTEDDVKHDGVEETLDHTITPLITGDEVKLSEIPSEEEELDTQTVSSISTGDRDHTIAPSTEVEKETEVSAEILDHTSAPTLTTDDNKTIEVVSLEEEEGLDHTTIASTPEVQKADEEDSLASTAAPSIDIANIPHIPGTISAEDYEKETIEVSTEETEEATINPSHVEDKDKPIEDILGQTVSTSTEGEKKHELPEETLSQTTISSLATDKPEDIEELSEKEDELPETVTQLSSEAPEDILDHTISSSAEQETKPEKIQTTVAPSDGGVQMEVTESSDEDLAHTVIPSSSLEDDHKIPDISDEILSHTTAASIAESEKEATADSSEKEDGTLEHTVTPLYEISAHTDSPSIETDKSEETDEILTQTIAPLSVEQESTEVSSDEAESLGQTIVPSYEEEQKQHLEETSTVPLSEADKEPAQATTESSLEQEADLSSTVTPSYAEDQKTPLDETADHTVVPSSEDIEKPDLSDITSEHKISLPISGDDQLTTEASLKQESDLSSTATPSYTEDQKKPHEALTSEDEQLTTESSLDQQADISSTISPAEDQKKTDDETLAATVLPSTDDVKKPAVSDDTSEQKLTSPISGGEQVTTESSLEEEADLSSTVTPSKAEAEEEPLDETMAHTVAPSTGDVEKTDVSDETSEQIVPSPISEGEEVSTEASSEEEEDLSSTFTPSYVEDQKQPLDESLAHTIVPPTGDLEKTDVSDETSEQIVTSPISEGEQVTTESSLEQEEELSSTVTPSYADDQKQPLDDTMAQTILPSTNDGEKPDTSSTSSVFKDDLPTTGASADDEELSSTVTPLYAEDQKKPLDGGLAHTTGTSDEDDTKTDIADTTSTPAVPAGDKESLGISSEEDIVPQEVSPTQSEVEKKPVDTPMPTVEDEKKPSPVSTGAEDEKKPTPEEGEFFTPTDIPLEKDEQTPDLSESTLGHTTAPSDQIQDEKESTEVYTDKGEEEPSRTTTPANIENATDSFDETLSHTITPSTEGVQEPEGVEHATLVAETSDGDNITRKPVIASLDSVEEAAESAESEEETTGDQKVQHIAEFVTERTEEDTTEKVHKLDDSTTEKETEPASQEGESIEEETGEVTDKDITVQTSDEVSTSKPQIMDESIKPALVAGTTDEVSTEKTELSEEESVEDSDEVTSTTLHPLFAHLASTTTPTIDERFDIVNATSDLEEALKPSTAQGVLESEPTIAQASSTEVSPSSEEEVSEHSTTPTTTSTTTVHTTSELPITTAAPITHQTPPPSYGQPPQYPTYSEDEYTDEDETEVFGPGTCRYGGKLYVSAQQIPRDDPCDFCFCFRSDIICLQQSCPPPIAGCHEEPISGFCCPRYECPVSMATVLNITTSTTTTSTTLPPHFLHHSYGGAVQRNGCQINGRSYKVGEKIDSTSGPCINCTCGGDGKMKCDPQACVPEPTMQQVMAVVAAGRKR